MQSTTDTGGTLNIDHHFTLIMDLAIHINKAQVWLSENPNLSSTRHLRAVTNFVAKVDLEQGREKRSDDPKI